MTTEQAEQAIAEALTIIRTEVRRRVGPNPAHPHPIETLELDAGQVEQWRAYVEALLE